MLAALFNAMLAQGEELITERHHYLHLGGGRQVEVYPAVIIAVLALIVGGAVSVAIAVMLYRNRRRRLLPHSTIKELETRL